MNNLLKAIEILQLHLRENNNSGKHSNITSGCPTILSEKNNNCYLLYQLFLSFNKLVINFFY